jgi:2-polyprenyl-6-hydroxyphenyl methylase/3-demethylubiquinone-9 3-methyltransferase
LQAVIGAEYILRLLPRGTHDYARFIKPAELIYQLTQSNIECVALQGMGYQLSNKTYYLRPNVDVNYLVAARKVI